MTEQPSPQDEPIRNTPPAADPGTQPQAPAAKPPARRKDKWVKWVFGLAVLGAIIAVWIIQRSGPVAFQNWRDNLPAAIDEASRDDRKVLVLFGSSPPGQDERKLGDAIAKKQNAEAITQGGFIAVRVVDGELARKWKVQRMPTMLILQTKGNEVVELNRREGYIGEVAFRDEFLSLKVIQPAAPDKGAGAGSPPR